MKRRNAYHTKIKKNEKIINWNKPKSKLQSFTQVSLSFPVKIPTGFPWVYERSAISFMAATSLPSLKMPFLSITQSLKNCNRMYPDRMYPVILFHRADYTYIIITYNYYMLRFICVQQFVDYFIGLSMRAENHAIRLHIKWIIVSHFLFHLFTAISLRINIISNTKKIVKCIKPTSWPFHYNCTLQQWDVPRTHTHHLVDGKWLVVQQFQDWNAQSRENDILSMQFPATILSSKISRH